MSQRPEPSDLFRVLRAADPPEEFWDGFWSSIRAGIGEDARRRPPVLTLRRALLFGSSAGLLAAAAVLGVAFLAVRYPGKPEPVPATSSLPAAVPVRGEEKPAPPILEDLGSSTARVYTFHVGEPADATDVILIVDESLDI